jgi:hypothetical protein
MYKCTSFIYKNVHLRERNRERSSATLAILFPIRYICTAIKSRLTVGSDISLATIYTAALHEAF